LAWPRWLSILYVSCVFLTGCNNNQHKKPDPTEGVVAGIVLCADTGKPARFATVTLWNAEESKAPEFALTDLDGRFRMEAVEPGHYYAFGTLEGYLDPSLALDPDKIKSMSPKDAHLYSIDAWKDHLKEVTVGKHRVSEISLQIERAAEISGTVTFDDGAPAIGMRFQVLRKTGKNGWTNVGLTLIDTWSIRAVSEGHGRYSITNLLPGEYTVCALMPIDTEQAASRICLGGVFRKKDAKTVKVGGGEVAGGNDIEIPLSGLRTVAGNISAMSDGHPVRHGTVRLLYRDDRETARETSFEDGSFEFQYVPDGTYILQVSDANDMAEGNSQPDGEHVDGAVSGGNAAAKYADKEIALEVMDNLEDANVALDPVQPKKQDTQE
jgi:hypothetical protein